MTVTEVVVALVVLSAAMLAVVKLLTVAGGQRRLAEERRIALQEIANQAERIAALPWEATAPGRLTSWQPSPELSAALPAATCQIQVEEQAGPLVSRQIRLGASWQNSTGQALAPIELTIWRFQPREETP